MDGQQMAQALSANTNLPTEAEVTLAERQAHFTQSLWL